MDIMWWTKIRNIAKVLVREKWINSWWRFTDKCDLGGIKWNGSDEILKHLIPIIGNREKNEEA